MKELKVLEDKIEVLSNQLIDYNNKKSILDDSLFSPDKAEHYQKLATQLAKSSLVPKAIQNKPVDVFLVMAMAHKLNVSIEQGLQGIAVINGIPSVWGDLLLAIVKNQPDFVDIIEEPIYKNDKVFGFVCTVKRRNQTDVVRSFDLNDAKKANLLGKQGPWTQYESRMLQMRARAFACRDSFPDALKGLRVSEEVSDYIEGEFVEHAPKRVDKMINDIQSQGEEHETDNLQNNHKTDSMADQYVNQKTDQNFDDAEVVGSRGEKESSDGENKEVLIIDNDQMDEIERLLQLKSISYDRQEKAMIYYGVNKLSELSWKQADHYIKTLNKEKSKK